VEGGRPREPDDEPEYYYTSSVYAPDPLPAKTNGFAVAALVTGALGFLFLTAIVAVVFGAVALSQIKLSPAIQAGRGLAISGIALGAAWLAIYTTVIVLDATLTSFNAR
jgi:Domain of unknown function (DUF4190)